MRYRRSKFEIYVDILFLIKGGESKPTVLMERANVHWNVLMRSVRTMIKNGHIEELDPFARARAINYHVARDRRLKIGYGLTQEGELLVAHLRTNPVKKLMKGFRK